MNKNTIIKLIAVLAMCFLIGGALVACKGAAGPAGPQGPQGEKGETGAAGSTPELTIGANGNWFADGVDLGVKAPSADAACAEHDFAYVDVVKHTQTEDGIVVKACKTCGFAAITTETLHVMKDGEIPANCLEAKWVGSFCEICNFKGEGKFVGEALGHDYTKAQPVTETYNGKYICVDGGMLVQHCKLCKDIQYTTVEAGEYPHTIYNWSLIGQPTEDNYGVAFGTCTICGADEYLDLPLINEWAFKVLEVVDCGNDGEYEYTYVNADRNLNLSFKLDIEATGHKLDGKNYAEYDMDADNSNGVVVPYWYGTADAAGRLSAHSIKPFAGQKFSCGETQSGYFYCEECKDVVNIDVYYDHNGKTEIVTDPTCCSIGSKKVDCDNCPFDSFSESSETYGVLVDVPALPHVYLYELVETTIETIDEEEVQLYNLVGTCKGNGAACDPSNDGYTKILAEDIYNVEKKDVKAANCLEYGQVKYTFNKLGADRKYTETVLVPKTNHILNGKEVEIGVDNVVEGMTTATPGVKAFTNGAFKDVFCEASVEAYFVCEYCSTVEGAESVVAVTITKAHTETNVRVDDSNPATCEQAGSKLFDCTNANCNDPDGKDIVGSVPALGHDYKYVVEGNDDDGFKVWQVCQRAECQSDDCTCAEAKILVGEYDKLTKIAEVAPTCYSEGYTLYKVVIAGETNELKIVLPKTNHKLAGLIQGSPKFNAEYVNPDNGAIYSTVPGIKVFANETLTCDQTADGYYECEVCKELVNGVKVYQAHVIKEVIIPSKCESTGTAKCANGDHEFTTPALGHDWKLDYEVDLENGTVEITGKCKRTTDACVAEEEWTFDLPDPADGADDEEDFLANGSTYYAKPVLVKAANCVEAAVYALTVNFDKDGNAIAIADLADSVVFITVTFEVETEANGHDYENALVLAVKKDEIIDEETEETATFYYMVQVCNDCGTYKCVAKYTAEQYATYLESLKNA